MRKNFRILLTSALLLFANAAIAQGATAHNVKGTITIATPIVKEDFSKFTDGSEEKPSATNIAASGTIAASYTSVAGWTGASVFQAGGAAYIGMDNSGFWPEPGRLVTPAFDATGNDAVYHVKFRARSSASTDNLTINRKSKGNTNVALTNDWQEFTIDYTSGTATEKITFSPQNHECFIDDIDIYQTHQEEADVAPEGAVLYENFNKFTAGTEMAPKQGDIAGQDYIPDTLTMTPGWKGKHVFQAGGTAYLSSNGEGDFGITTPVVDLSHNAGTFTLQLKAKLYTGGQASTLSSSVIGYLYEVVNGVPQLVETQYADISNTWADYSMTFNRGTASSQLVIAFYVGEGWIDDVALVQPTSTVKAPVATEYAELTETGFTANWLPVEGAQSYLLSVYERGNGTRTYVLQDKAVAGTSCAVTGVDTSKPYYYNVKAVKDGVKSIESNQIMVLGLPVVTLLPASGITTTGFTAHWKSLNRATTYIVTSYINHTATEPETFALIDEDFKNFKSGSIDKPDTCRSIEYNVNDKLSRADWVARNRLDIKGGIGLDNSEQKQYGTGWLHSPLLDLSNNDGNVSVTLSTYGSGAKRFDVALCDADGKKISAVECTATNAWNSVTVELTGGTQTSYISIELPESQTGSLFINALKVTQQLAVGDSITVPYIGKEVLKPYKAKDEYSADFSIDNWAKSDTYSYTVQGRRTFSSTYILPRYIYSHKQAPVIVNYPVSTGVGNVAVSQNTDEVMRYNVAGQRVDANYKGIQIIRQSDGTTVKRIIR